MNCRIRLHFFCIQICLHSCLIPGWDMLQIGFKMSPNICLVKNVAKNIVAVIIGLTLCFTTPLKCYSLVFRIMPEMNESKVSKYVMFLTSILSVLVCGIKFIGVTKPTYNQVSIPCISRIHTYLLCKYSHILYFLLMLRLIFEKNLPTSL